jgi:hypothetical protein
MLMLVLVSWLVACDPTARPVPPEAQAAAAIPLAPPTAEPAISAADAGLAIAVARETVDRAAREQTLHVQQLLRDQARKDKQARDAARRGDGHERCLSGQRMRRVENGWVQAGRC